MSGLRKKSAKTGAEQRDDIAFYDCADAIDDIIAVQQYRTNLE